MYWRVGPQSFRFQVQMAEALYRNMISDTPTQIFDLHPTKLDLPTASFEDEANIPRIIEPYFSFQQQRLVDCAKGSKSDRSSFQSRGLGMHRLTLKLQSKTRNTRKSDKKTESFLAVYQFGNYIRVLPETFQ